MYGRQSRLKKKNTKPSLEKDLISTLSFLYSFSRDGFVDEKMWASSFLNGKRVLYIAREANATGKDLLMMEGFI